jgi:hypothetical protein
MEAEPISGVTVPLDVEAIAAAPVEAGERGVDELVAAISRLSEGPAKLDPLEDPILQTANQLTKFRGTKADVQKLSNKLDQLKNKLAPASKWYDRFANERIQNSLSALIRSLRQTTKA